MTNIVHCCWGSGLPLSHTLRGVFGALGLLAPDKESSPNVVADRAYYILSPSPSVLRFIAAWMRRQTFPDHGYFFPS